MASSALPIDPAHSVPSTAAAANPITGTANVVPLSKPHKSNLLHHEDVWNEEATFALLEAWGTKYVELNHGGLSRADWAQVAQQVVLHSGKATLTDTQCRNRIDTLKKKYKREKHKLATLQGSSSNWVYFPHMDSIINPAANMSYHNRTAPSQPSFTHTPAPDHVRSKDICLGRDDNPGKDVLKTVGANENLGHDDVNIISASYEPPDESELSQTSLNSSGNHNRDRHKVKRQKSSGSSFRVLAKALIKFADVYERIETTKLQHALDLEKTRMEVTRNFEIQRWQLLLQTQMELAKIKDGAHDSHQSIDSTNANLFATCFMPAEYCLRTLL
ncbi:hypothetical protein KP509_38G044200 [Ceratopteris richardii]|uniref:Myb/SANT-like DNA-binding domain-containing protein n=1 Tax=Ceratopteris richardii TaxID=49495 RepID=A0A8T2Q492_CERRI|nr:hypothetical protein KP509_38G044200 [Ceratopteris richardii]